jgi:5-carboxymethyl-2-hydroxymuconate isomerase
VPHFVVEYTDNVAQCDIPALLAKASATLAAQNGVFPLGGIRARAMPAHQYSIANSQAGDAFVHATLKIGSGRTPEAKKKVCDELFGLLQEHFQAAAARPNVTVSMELYEFDEGGTYKLNNVHARFRPAPRGA